MSYQVLTFKLSNSFDQIMNQLFITNSTQFKMKKETKTIGRIVKFSKVTAYMLLVDWSLSKITRKLTASRRRCIKNKFVQLLSNLYFFVEYCGIQITRCFIRISPAYTELREKWGYKYYHGQQDTKVRVGLVSFFSVAYQPLWLI